MVKAETSGHQPVNCQESIASLSLLYPAVESVFLRLKPKVYPPPPPPSKQYLTLQDDLGLGSPVEVLSTDDKQQCTTTDGKHQGITIKEVQQWSIFDSSDGVSSSEDDAYPVREPKVEHPPSKVKPTASHDMHLDYYCHCCGSQSFIYSLMDLY